MGHHHTRYYEKRYLFSQIKSKTDVRAEIEEVLNTSWNQLINTYFKLSDSVFTLTGQKVAPQMTSRTFECLISPFHKILTGTQRGHMEISEIVSNYIMKSVTTQTPHLDLLLEIWSDLPVVD